MIIAVYSLNLLAVWVLEPQGLFPSDLEFLKNYLWRPPSLNFQVVSMPTSQVQILQMLTIISLFGILLVQSSYSHGEMRGMGRKRRLKISGRYQIKRCKNCGAYFVLGILDPDVDYCPLCGYKLITERLGMVKRKNV